MKANEFRVTNLVLNDRIVNAIIMIGVDSVELVTPQGNLITARLELIKPVPLTEEWLKKFGFEKDDMDFYTLMLIDKPSAKISISLDWQITEVCQAGYGFSVQCKCVHQLQNIYFALTGKELTIKP